MRFKVIPAYLPDSSNTVRLNPEDTASLLLRANDEYLKQVVRELCVGAYYKESTKVARTLRTLLRMATNSRK